MSWWKVENLMREEKLVRLEENKGGNSTNLKSDFGSYNLLKRGFSIKDSKLCLHNDVDPQYKIDKSANWVHWLCYSPWIMPSKALKP